MQFRFPEQEAVRIAGAGIVCSLGRGADTVADGLIGAQSTPTAIPPATAGEKPLPYFRFPDEGGPEYPLHWSITHAIDAAITEAAAGPSVLEETAVLVGTSSLDIGYWEQRYIEAMGRGGADFVPVESRYGGLAAAIAGRIGSRERQFVFNTACTSSANALLYAARMIRTGLVPHALVVGVELFNHITLRGFDALMLLSHEVLRPFDRDRDGVVLGEGVGAIFLSGAASRGPKGELRLRSGFTHTDTHSPTVSPPCAIERTILGALDDGGISPGEVAAIKAHGTGTPASDETEAVGTRRAFGDVLPPIASLKGSIGHTLGACGALETAALAGCLRRGLLPPTGGFARPDPELGIEPLASPMPLEAGYVLSNFFGFGGSNTSLVFEICE